MDELIIPEKLGQWQNSFWGISDNVVKIISLVFLLISIKSMSSSPVSSSNLHYSYHSGKQSFMELMNFPNLLNIQFLPAALLQADSTKWCTISSSSSSSNNLVGMGILDRSWCFGCPYVCCFQNCSWHWQNIYTDPKWWRSWICIFLSCL